MFGATTNYPYNFANRNGIPMIESSSVTVNTDNITIGIPNRAFRFLNGTGLILFRLNTAIPESADTLPILFSSNDFTQPVTLTTGSAATGAQMGGTGIYLIYYAKDCNLMQLLTTDISTTQTQSTSTTAGTSEEPNNSTRTIKK